MSENINLDDIRKLSEEVNSLVNSGVIPLNENTKDVVDKFGKLADAVSKVNMNDLGKSVKKATDALGDLSKSTEDLIEEQEKQDKVLGTQRAAAVKQFGKDLLSAGGSFMSAVNSAEQGTGKYSKSVEQLGLSASKLGEAFGAAGAVIGWGAEKIMQWAGASLRQNEVLVKSYQSLSKFGQVDNTDLKQLMQDFHDMGAVTENMNVYVNAISKVSSELAMFGATATEGRQQFKAVMEDFVGGATQDHLMRLGYTTQDIMESAAQAMANMAMASNGQKRDVNALHQSVAEYLETQAELTSLTGKNRDEAAAARREQENDIAFQMKLAQLETQGEKGRQQAQQWRDAAAMGLSLGGKSGQMAMQQGLRTGGALVGPEARQFAQAIGLGNFRNMVAAGNMTGTREQRADAMADAGKAAAKGALGYANTMLTAMSYSRTGNMPSIGLTPELYKNAITHSTRGSAELQAERAKRALVPESDRIGLESKRIDKEREFQQTMDKASYAMGDLTVQAVTSLAGAANTATQALTEFSDSMGWTDSWNSQRKSFDKLTDVTEELNKQQKKQAEYLKEINEANDELARADKDISEAESTVKKGGLAGMWAEMRLGKFKENREAAMEKKARAEKGMTKSEKESDRAVKEGSRIQQAGGDPLEGLNMKPGANSRKYVKPELAEIMRKVSSEIPGFNRFTAVNDAAHGTDDSSMHSVGKAFDFTLSNPKPSAEELDAVIKQLRGYGLKVLDEYRHKSKNWTGPHIHAALQARTGGIFSGPSTGYQVELHGKEAVVPMNKMSQFTEKYNNDNVTKHSLNNPGSAVSSPMTHSDSGMLRQLMSVLVGRLDDMIYELQSANSASAKIAKNTKKK